MKPHKIIALLFLALLLLPACSQERSQEEKIRITIDKPETRKSQEPLPKPPESPEKPKPEAQKREIKPQAAKTEPEREPARPLKKMESAERRPAQDRSLDFSSVAAHLDLGKYSKQQIKDYFFSIRGKRVFWAGTVYQARMSRKGFKILVENRNAPTRSGYNIVLVKKGPSAVGDISKGTDIRFSGVIIDVEAARPGSGPIIVLVDSKILN